MKSDRRSPGALSASLALNELLSRDESHLSQEKLASARILFGEGARDEIVDSVLLHAVSALQHEWVALLCPHIQLSATLSRAFDIVINQAADASSERVLQLLLAEGANGPAVSEAAALAATACNIATLEFILQSSAAESVVLEAFKAVTQEKIGPLSSQELRILSVLVQHGICTEALASASVNAAKLHDINALRLFSEFRQFQSTTEDTLRALLSEDEFWRSSKEEGPDILRILLQGTVSQESKSVAASKAAAALNFRMLGVLLSGDTSTSLVESAFSSMVKLGNAWATPEGLRIVHAFLPLDLISQKSKDAAFIQACEQFNHGAMELFFPEHGNDTAVFDEALTKAISTGTLWVTESEIVGPLIDSCGAKAVESALAEAARSLDLHAVRLLSERPLSKEAHSRAFSSVLRNEEWLHALDIIKFFLDLGVDGAPAEKAYIMAAGRLNRNAFFLLAESIYDIGRPDVNNRAFTSATTNSSWVSDDGIEIVKFLAAQGATGAAVGQALIESARNLRRDIVEVLLPNVGMEDAGCFSVAASALVTSNEDWFSKPEGYEIMKIFLRKEIDPDTAAEAFVSAAHPGGLRAVRLLTPLVKDPAVYGQALQAFAKKGATWLHLDSREVLLLLLDRAHPSPGLDELLVSALENDEVEADLDLVHRLLKAGADINHRNGQAVQCAVQSGRTDVVRLLLLPRSDPTPATLHLGLKSAICSGLDEERVLALLDQISSSTPDLDMHEVGTERPLIFDALERYPSSARIASKLRELGADLNSTTSWRLYDEGELDLVSPLLYAIARGVSEVVIREVLLRHGARWDYIPIHSKASPLLLAARCNRHEVVSLLLQIKATRVDHRDCHDRTPLFYAARHGYTKIVGSLLKRGPPENDGSLHEAARGLHTTIVKMLLAAGHDANFRATSKHGFRSPLCELCLKSEPTGIEDRLNDVLRLLKAEKADALVQCGGRTPLFYALENLTPIPVVTGLLDVFLVPNESLNDARNLFVQDGFSYSATKYIEENVRYEESSPCGRSEETDNELLRRLKSAGASDRFYANGFAKQPPNAVGMPRKIAEQEEQSWLRSRRLEELKQDEMRQDQLTAERHRLQIQQRQDMARQILDEKTDTSLQAIQLRSLEHAQNGSHKDNDTTAQMEATLANHFMRQNMDQRNRGSVLLHENEANEQKLSLRAREQDVAFDGEHSRARLKIATLADENLLKKERDLNELMRKAAQAQIEMDQVQHMSEVQVRTQEQTDKINRESQLHKVNVEELSRQSQLGFHRATDERKLATEEAMLAYRHAQNIENLQMKDSLNRSERQHMSGKNAIEQQGRQNQLLFSQAQNKVDLAMKGSLYHLEQNHIYEKNALQDRERTNQLSFTQAQNMETLQMKDSLHRSERQHLSGKNAIEQQGRQAQNKDDLAMKGNLYRLEQHHIYAKSALQDLERRNQLSFTQASDAQKLTTQERAGYLTNLNFQQRGQIENGHLQQKQQLLYENRTNESQHMALAGQQRAVDEALLGEARARNEFLLGGVRIQNELNTGEARASSQARMAIAKR